VGKEKKANEPQTGKLIKKGGKKADVYWGKGGQETSRSGGGVKLKGRKGEKGN